MESESDATKSQDRKTAPSMSIFYSNPLLVCVAFAAGLFIASVTFNLALYYSLRTKYGNIMTTEDLNPVSPLAKRHGPSAMVLPKHQNTSAAVDIYDNIVMIQVSFATYNRLMPWQTIRATFQDGLEDGRDAQSGGIILDNGLILTSAYVATDSQLIEIQRPGESKKYEAKVLTVSQDLDIALLTTDEDTFWRNTDLKISLDVDKHIIGRGNAVVVAGFPLGGDLSISKLSSRVSRVEAGGSGFKGRYGSFPHIVLNLYPEIGNDLTVGPVFREHDNALVGFCGRGDKVLPVQTIATFVKAYQRDHTSAGFGMMGLMYRPMQAPALRKYWDMPQDDVGVQIRSVDEHSQFSGRVQPGDVLLAIDDHPIHADGAIIYDKTIDNFGVKNNVGVPFPVLLAEKSLGDKVKMSFRRSVERPQNADGQHGYKHLEDFVVEAGMQRLQPLVQRSLDVEVMEPPTYAIVGGLVWTVFSESLVLHAEHMKEVYIPPATAASAMHRWRGSEDEEVVVFLRALEHPCNKWYGLSQVRILRFINGEKVINMKQFVAEVGNVLARGEQLKFTFEPLDDDDTAGDENDPDVVLDTKLCNGADRELMMTHQIPTPASMNLKESYATIPKSFSQFEFPTHSPTGQEPRRTQVAGISRQATLNGHSVHNHPKEGATEVKQQLGQLPWANVVQIRLVAAEADFLSPWKTMPPEGSRCSAIIVDRVQRLIMTNSHCVVSGVAIDVLREDAPIPVPARVLEIARDVDLAMITTDDDAFWADDNMRETVSMKEGLPHISHSVRVVGYPTGGSSVTITQGIVSRVDGQLYPNGLVPGARNTPDELMIVQIDAAINPGNSGGPVFDSRGNLVGLAFAGIGGLQSVGYVIPNVYLRNFIFSVSSDSTGHRWRAQPELGAGFRPIENPGIRDFLSLKDGETGVQVRTVSPYSALAKNGIKKGDVLLRVDGLQVQGNGKIVRDLNGNKVTLPLETKITEKAINETSKLEFIHYDAGKRTLKVVEDVFGPIPPLIPRFYDAPKGVKGRKHFAAQPTYYILWGLVWGVFSNPVLHQAMERKVEIPWSVRKDAMHRWLTNDTDEVVVLLQGLGHPCTLYYDVSTMRILDYFNGRKVNNMRELVTYALEADLMQEEYMRITFKPLADKDLAGSVTDPDIVLHRSMCQGADPEIMQSYNIANQGSPDVAEYFLDAKAMVEKKYGNLKREVASSSLFQSNQEQATVELGTGARSSKRRAMTIPNPEHDPFSLTSVDPKPVGALNDIEHEGANQELSLPGGRVASHEENIYAEPGNSLLEPAELSEQQSRKLRRGATRVD